MVHNKKRLLFGAASCVALVAASTSAVAQDRPIALDDISVIGTSPLGGDQLDRDKVPANVISVTSDQIRSSNTPTVQEGFAQTTPSVSISDVTGNPFNKEVFFRGFQSSQQNGAPQGLAVYQNGVRINEAFGDTVNYEFIPTVAIDRLDVWTNNPVFGLNALGGALSFQTKSGFTFQGVELEAQAGSFDGYSGSAQWGTQVGPWAAYIAIEGAKDGGWRDYSDSNVKRVFGDVGYKTDSAEIHLNVTYADSKLGVVGPTPFELLEQRRRNVYTGDQINENTMGMLNLQGKFEINDAWSLQANAYVRRYKSKRVDGNDTDVRPCEDDATLLCLEADDFPGVDDDDPRLIVRDVNTGLPVANPGFVPDADGNFPAGLTPGSIENSRVRTTSAGGTLQATNDSELFGRKNHFVIGAAYDFGKTDFKGFSELCFIPENLQCIGTGDFYYTEIPGGITPVDLTAKNHYVGLYATNTYDLTDRLSATLGGRFNYAKVITKDKGKFQPLNEDRDGPAGPNLDGNHTFTRFNPMGGLTYKITPDITGYVSYSESNRAPTPLELGCSNPDIPCPLESTLVSDPPLKQVVTRTGEIGLRGKTNIADGLLRWSFSLYRANNNNDILSIPSSIAGRAYFDNVGKTRRQGVELAAQYSAEKWALYANYSYVDATFRKDVTLGSPNNPEGDDGDIEVKKGDRLTGIPAHQFKVGGAYRVTPQWTVGADAQIFGSQFYVGDESNQNGKLKGYTLVNVNTSYQVTEQVRVFGGIRNLFNKKYETYGTFFDDDDIGFLDLDDPRSLTPARPISFYAGLNYKFSPKADPVLVTKY